MKKIDQLRVANTPTRVIALLAVAGLVWVGYTLATPAPDGRAACGSVASELVASNTKPEFRGRDGSEVGSRLVKRWETVTVEQIAAGDRRVPAGWKLNAQGTQLIGPNYEITKSARVEVRDLVTPEGVAEGLFDLPAGLELVDVPTSCVEDARDRVRWTAGWVAAGAVLLGVAWMLFGRDPRAEGRE